MKYTIREIGPGDLDNWWALRLLALETAPSAFGSDYETALQQGPSYAERGYFDGGVNRIFGAYTSEGDIVAQAGTYGESGKRSHIAQIISIFTHPEHRGNGLATRLVQACINHLQAFPHIKSIRISVNATNYPAIHVYEKLGFVAWGEEPDAIRTSDGSCHNELHMVLKQGARRS